MRTVALLLAVVACGRSHAPDSTSSAAPPAPAAPAPPAPAPPAITVPAVDGQGYGPPSEGTIPVVVTPTALELAGQRIATLHHDELDPKDLEGGAAGMKMPRLTARAKDVIADARQRHRDPRFALQLAPSLTYGVLITTMRSIVRADGRAFELVARAKGARVAAPLDVPDQEALDDSYGTPREVRSPNQDLGRKVEAATHPGLTPDAAPPRRDVPPLPAAEPDPLGMYVSVTKDHLQVWSLSRLEGTRKAPKVTIPLDAQAAAKLSRVLGEIVARRYPDRRPRGSTTIVLLADRATPMQTIAALIGAIRAAPDGTPLFPDILLSIELE